MIGSRTLDRDDIKAGKLVIGRGMMSRCRLDGSDLIGPYNGKIPQPRGCGNILATCGLFGRTLFLNKEREYSRTEILIRG